MKGSAPPTSSALRTFRLPYLAATCRAVSPVYRETANDVKAHTHTHTRTHTHTQMHTHTHSHADAHTHTHTHTTYNNSDETNLHHYIHVGSAFCKSIDNFSMSVLRCDVQTCLSMLWDQYKEQRVNVCMHVY